MLLRRFVIFSKGQTKTSVTRCFSQEEKKSVLLFGAVGKNEPKKKQFNRNQDQQKNTQPKSDFEHSEENAQGTKFEKKRFGSGRQQKPAKSEESSSSFKVLFGAQVSSQEVFTDDIPQQKFRRQYVPSKFEVTSNVTKNVNKNHLQILKSTHEKFLQIPNADFKIFMSKSIQNTNTQTLIFFLLGLISNSQNPAELKISEFLTSTDLDQFCKSYRSEDYQLLNNLLKEVSKIQAQSDSIGTKTSGYLRLLSVLQNRGLSLRWLDDTSIFGEIYQQAVDVQSTQDANLLLDNLNLAFGLLDSSFASGKEYQSETDSDFGILTLI